MISTEILSDNKFNDDNKFRDNVSDECETWLKRIRTVTELILSSQTTKHRTEDQRSNATVSDRKLKIDGRKGSSIMRLLRSDWFSVISCTPPTSTWVAVARAVGDAAMICDGEEFPLDESVVPRRTTPTVCCCCCCCWFDDVCDEWGVWWCCISTVDLSSSSLNAGNRSSLPWNL